ncbi:hypothetical protein Ccrd_009573 [Cynara cardunculus var. scolymus]|uniref:AP2/ERF domain-containing protein n=1 Tax=Cynara cardunculus var. scolymus TaxID=59895 RepID=A0A118K7C2_CYNCS|nr:hypothetical protein Ccrd_009573 [Cynara cardunculus var. scolymus]
MLDLNMSFVHEDERMAFRGEVEESATSNSSVINAEGCNSSNAGEGDDDSISAAMDGDSFRCFNFDILKVGDTAALPSNGNSNSNDEDRMSQTQSEFVTRTLFPVSHGEGGGGGRLNQGQQVNSLLLFPNNNELQDTRMIQVPQQKPTVQLNQVGKKSRRGPRSRSSQYRGVTFYRRTGRWESHIWDCGKQVYLGGFDTAHAAARAYDRAAIKFRGVDADINFNLSDYEDDMNQIKNLSKEDFVHILRRHSSGFSRGNSKYRGGVTVQKCGGSEAQMGEFLGKKAHEKAAIKINGGEAVTNFEANTYKGETVSASHCGSDHNLDLNLGISTPSCLGKCSSRTENLEHMQLNHGLHDIRRLQVENPATMTLRGLPVISEHGQSWTGMYPTFFPSYEVGATYSRFVGGSSQGPSNWAWQFHGQSRPPTTLFTAASSGFPAPTAATNSPHHHYQIRPRPSPPPAPPPTP